MILIIIRGFNSVNIINLPVTTDILWNPMCWTGRARRCAPGPGSFGIGAMYDVEAQRLLGLNTVSVLVYVVAAGSVKQKKAEVLRYCNPPP